MKKFHSVAINHNSVVISSLTGLGEQGKKSQRKVSVTSCLDLCTGPKQVAFTCHLKCVLPCKN